MRVLVTGSKGLVGTLLTITLLRGGHEVVEYDIKDGQSIFDEQALLEAMTGCEAVVHLAAISFPHPQRTLEEFWALNCVGVQKVAEAAYKCGVKKFVFSSSMTYYGFEHNIPDYGIETPVHEGHRHISQYMKAEQLEGVTPPTIFYMQSKVVAENILAVYGFNKLMQVVILRLSPVRGDPYLGLNVYNENVSPAIVKVLETDRVMWYEVFNIANPTVEKVDTSKWDSFWGDEWQYC